MIRQLSGKGAMTLVEVLVAGVIGLVPAITIGILSFTYNDQLQENNANLALQRNYETVIMALAGYSRRATKVLAGTDACNHNCADSITTSEIFFYDDCSAAAPFARLRIQDGLLQDSVATGWTDFTAGGNNTVLLDGQHSGFWLPGCRNSIRINLHLQQTLRDTTITFSPPPCEFLCRN